MFDECMVLMTNRLGPLVRESISRRRKMKIKGICRNIVCIMSTLTFCTLDYVTQVKQSHLIKGTGVDFLGL